MKRKITTLMMLMFFVMGGIMQTFAQAKENGSPNFTYIDDFEIGVDLWWAPEGSGSTAGIVLEDDEGNLITYRAHETDIVNPATGSTGSMKLAIQWNNTIDYEGTPTHLVRQHMPAGNANIPERQFQPGQALEVFVYGDGSGNRFRFMTRDGIPQLEGSTWHTIDWVGWKRITWDYNNPENVVGWVNGNGEMDGVNFYFDSFQITKDAEGSATGATLYFDDFRIVDPFAVNFNIAGADGTEVISINNVVYDAGETEFEFFPGEYQYFVQKEGFVTATGTFEVDDEDVMINITLTGGDDPEYTVTFTILDEEGNLLTDAVITLNDETFAPNEYVFDLTPGFYNYEVNKTLYFPSTGSFSVVGNNVFINVVLQEIPDVYDHIYLKWDVASTANQAIYREEYYSVWIAALESADQPFDTLDYVMVFEETLSSDIPNWQYQPRMVEISEFEQHHVRIAFRHHNSTDMDRIVIDNVRIEGVEESLETPDIIFHEDFMGGVPDFDPLEEEIPDYDDEWLPEGWLALDLDDDGLNWYYSIVVEQDYSITAHMRSQSYDADAGVLTPDNWLITPVIELPMVLFHTITFEVKDAEGAAIADAVITFDGETYAPGVYAFSRTNGTYEYHVERADYVPVSGTIVVAGANVTEEVTLELIGIYEVTFTINMQAYGGFEPGDEAFAYMTGNFPGWDNADPADFPEAQMEKTNNIWIFTKTLHMPAGTYTYLYFDGPSFAHAEWNINDPWRTIVVVDDMDVDDIFAQPTSVNEVDAAGINIFPNPANSKVTITSDSPIMQISIFNIAGQQVYTNNAGAETHSIELGDFNNGIYMVRVLTANGMETYKLQVIK
ncbi:MAG: T9SS C-terminal target domain-containing protein [Bacteroidetes bacterium]|nr:MAG: T9SS C-terminal target domain-containing protein [Bacteroidota bacterium]